MGTRVPTVPSVQKTKLLPGSPECCFFFTKDSWKRDDTEKEKELFSTILSHRKDLHDASMAREEEGDLVTNLSLLETEIESFYSRIRQAFVKPNEHQQDIDALERQVEQARTEYSEIVET